MKKLHAIREAAKLGFPTSDVRTMLTEIERGSDTGFDAMPGIERVSS